MNEVDTEQKSDDEKKKPHLSKNFKGYHKRTGQAKNGACLWGHNARYAKSSCSYRWQAHNKAIAAKAIYRPKQKKGPSDSIDTLAYDGKKELFPKGYSKLIPFPTIREDTHDWCPTKDGNFQKSWIVPYWHNAHHLIPKGMFIDQITAAANSDPVISIIIQQALLNAKYNINQDINMIILPQDAEVARLLSLPRHLCLMEGGEYTSHSSYDESIAKSPMFKRAMKAMVGQELKIIIDNYKNAVENANQKDPKEHPEVKAEANKTKLEDLSKKLYDEMTKTNSKVFNPGEPLESMNLTSILS